MKLFRTLEGLNVDVIDHSLNILKMNSATRIYVGTDSFNIADQSVYATVIGYRYNFRGVHLIYNKLRVTKQTDVWARLWKEVELSLETAMHLNDNGIHVHAIDLDFNEDEYAGSNKLIKSAKGWCVGMGFKTNTKPDETLSARAADHICRGLM